MSLYGFVLIGLTNLIYIFMLKENTQKKYAIVMLIGLVFAMAGDIVLNIFFVGGAALFAIGHVFYFVAYCFATRFKVRDLIVAAIIFVPSLLTILLVPIFDFGGTFMQIVCVVYALIISCMLGKAISDLITNKNIFSIIVAVGSLLFFFSDLMLLFDVFGDVGLWADILCLATYYPAQCFLAYSIKVEQEVEKQNEVKEEKKEDKAK
jgi:uncharacterized membrane protein YhhN